MTFSAEDQAGLIAWLKSQQAWDWATKLRDLKLPGRPKERVEGVTPQQRRSLDLRADVIAAGGNLKAFQDDPRIPSKYATWPAKAEFLRKIVTFEDRNDLRKAHRVQKSQGVNISHPVPDEFDMP